MTNREIARGTFKGLFAFFVLLPLGIIAAFGVACVSCASLSGPSSDWRASEPLMPAKPGPRTAEEVVAMHRKLEAIKGDAKKRVRQRLKDEGVADRVATGVPVRPPSQAIKPKPRVTDKTLQAELDLCSAPPGAFIERGRAGDWIVRGELVDLPPEVRRIARDYANRGVRITVHKAYRIAGLCEYSD